MKITIDTGDSKEEIVKVIKLLQEAVKNQGYNSIDTSEKPEQNEFSLGALNFNDEPRVESVVKTVDLDETAEKDLNEPSQAEVEELLKSQTEKSSSSSINKSLTNQPSQPANAFGAMFGNENKNDIFSNDDGFGSNADGLGESSENNLSMNGQAEKKREKDDGWGPRKRMMLADLERY